MEHVEVGTHVSDLSGRVGILEEVNHETGKGVVTYGTQDRTTPKLTLDTATLARVIPPPLQPDDVIRRTGEQHNAKIIPDEQTS